MVQPTQKLKGHSPKLPSEQLLSLCMIVKNEERVLADCLASVRGVVDEIVIVDTGSTDRTVAIAESCNAKIFYFPWNGSFSDARNEALSHCTCRYILHLDADERLESRDRDRLRALVRRPSADAYEVHVVSRRTEGKKIVQNLSDQPRLFRRDERFRYRYRVHESILPSVRECGGIVARENITIHHVGYDISDEAMEQKKLRNLEQLVIDVRERPNDLFTLRKYAQTLLSLGRNEEAVREIKGMLEKIDGGVSGGVPAPTRAAFYNLYTDALIKTGSNQEAHKWAAESLRMLKDQNTAHYYLTIINDRLKQYDEALVHLNAITLQKKEGAVQAAEDDITPAPQDVCYKRAVLYRAMKKPLDERRELAAALRFDPQMTAALHDLAAFMAREKNFAQALSLITKARDTDPHNGSILHLRARILAQMARTDEALREAACAFACGEKGDSLLLFWIQIARETGKEAEALPAYALVVERHPEAADVLMAYIQLLVHRKELPAVLGVIEHSLPAVKDAAMRQTLTAIEGKIRSAARVSPKL